MTFRPASRRSSARSIRSRFSTLNSVSMRGRVATEPDGKNERTFDSGPVPQAFAKPQISSAQRNQGFAHDVTGPMPQAERSRRFRPLIRQPAELVAEAVVEGRARDLGQQH